MASINYDAVGFPRSMLNGAHVLPVRAAEIAWAAITIARTPFALPLPARDRAFEAAWRVAMVWANLVPTPGSFRRSSAYARLDMSEKSAVSFFLGQMQAKLFAERCFGVGVFAHVDAVLAVQGRSRARTRPDFIGFDGNSRLALAVEAKGRSNGWTAELVARAKAQSQSLPGVLGMAAPLAYAHVAFFEEHQWCAHLVDPPRPRRVADDVPPANVLTAYYSPLVELLLDLKRAERDDKLPDDLDADFVWARHPQAALTLGLHRNIMERRDVPDLPAQETSEGLEARRPDSYLGSDGVAILLDPTWSDWGKDDPRPETVAPREQQP